MVAFETLKNFKKIFNAIHYQNPDNPDTPNRYENHGIERHYSRTVNDYKLTTTDKPKAWQVHMKEKKYLIKQNTDCFF